MNANDPVERQVDAYNRRDIDAFLDCYAQDTVAEDASGNVVMSTNVPRRWGVSKCASGRGGAEPLTMASERPAPWAGIAAFVAVVAFLAWVPTGGLSGVITPIGFACLVAGWRSARRRWLLWTALVVNVYVLFNTVVVVA